ncbi:MAG: diguanylate cyclase [Gammaproteobacteria bacterium]|nr:diguanylate cyclase [Gammaproteobacteria bacterium]
MTRLLTQIFAPAETNFYNSNTHPHRRSRNLRLLFLAPLVFTIIVLVVVFIALRYQHANDDVQYTVLGLESSAQDFYDESVHHEIYALRGIIEVIRRRKDLSTALAEQDRIALLSNSERLFKSLRHHFNITHFYFMDTDRVNLLRVHTPMRFGDIIERTTMLRAEETGEVASGVELGALGTFTLRVVAPWYDGQQELIGYVELGMEIDHILNRLKEYQNVQLVTVINKKYLDREKWMAGMRDLGRKQDWDHFDDLVISTASDVVMPALLLEFLEREGSLIDFDIREMKYKNREYRIFALPIKDADGRNAAQMIMSADVTQMESDTRDAVYTVGLTALALGGALLVFFNWLIGGMAQRLELDEKELRKLATHDGLTNLYNQRAFYTMLGDCLLRSCRYQRPISLLLLDIDYFKAVNDNYGHQAGDAVLRDLSKRLTRRLRTTDRICRYGGEEITVILPETDTQTAEKIAEDLRHLIECDPFFIGGEQYINVTVSIGVATSSQHAKEVEQLVAGADTALYQAKDNGRNRVCSFQN